VIRIYNQRKELILRFAQHVLAIATFSVAAFQPALAGESPFGWIYTADVQPPGTKQFQQWIDVQRTQTQGYYSNTLLRTELEFGITPKYQTSIYLNSRILTANQNLMGGTSGGPNTDIPVGFDTSTRFKMNRLESVSWENLYQVSNPLIDPIGLALYFEPKWGPRNKELEFKLILQNNFLDDRLIWATNFVTSFEKNNRGDSVERSTDLDLLTGVSYRFANNWSAGAELRNHREFTGYGYGTPNHSAWFLGPNLHYATKGWWVTAAWRHQLKRAAGFSDEQRDVIQNGRIYGDEHTLNQFILKVGIPF
jgi:hypothetical protein